MDQALAAFAAEVRRAESELRLDRAALLIAAGAYPTLAVDDYLGQIAEYAAAAREEARGASTARQAAQAIAQVLFVRGGFCGNHADYYDPRNSYLNDVLDRRTGIPISLSILWLSIAWQLGLDAAGVGFPRHFIVRYRDGETWWIVDPFGGGQELPAGEFRRRAAEQSGARDHVLDYLLAAVTRRQILARMLANLKAIFLHRDDTASALRTQEYLVALAPWQFTEIRDRGVLRSRAGDRAGAIRDLETYLEQAGKEGDAPAIHDLLRRLRT